MKVILLVLIFVSISIAQNSKLELKITYPAEGDTFALEKVRYGAWISDTSANCFVNDQPTKVYSSGAVAGMLNLKEGWNKFIFKAENYQESILDTVNLFKPTPISSLPEIPTSISTEKTLPYENIIFYAPEILQVQFMGSPGGKAFFEIDDLLEDPLPMVELPNEKTGGIRGIYQGIYHIKPNDECDKEEIVFSLKGMDGDSEEWESGRFITVRQTGQPVLLKTAFESTLIFYRPGSEILMELPKGIEFAVLADYDRWLHIAVSKNLTGYIHRNAVEFSPPGLQVPVAALRGITSRFTNDWLEFSFNMSERIPFSIKQTRTPQTVELNLFNTYFQDEWSVYPENDSTSFFDHFTWNQTNDEKIQFKFFFNTSQQWGFRGWYDGTVFKIAFRKPPVITAENPFRNLIIALDAGHGGEHLGAVGATGYMEKDANLKYARYLATMLEDQGAKVILTRTSDSTMSLKSRADIARENNAHILVWMHNNSTGMSSDPLVIKGASTYYTHLQGLPFARYAYPELLNLGLTRAGQVHRTYYITRQSDMIIYLVEGAFLSNPDDEIFLLNDENLKNLAQAVFYGLKNYLITLVQ